MPAAACRRAALAAPALFAPPLPPRGAAASCATPPALRPPPPSQYEVFTAPTWEQLQAAPEKVNWCGFAHFAQPAACAFSLTPFQDVYVAIRTRRSGLLSMSESRPD